MGHKLQILSISLKIFIEPPSLTELFFFKCCVTFWPLFYSRRSGCFAERVVLQSSN